MTEGEAGAIGHLLLRIQALTVENDQQEDRLDKATLALEHVASGHDEWHTCCRDAVMPVLAELRAAGYGELHGAEADGKLAAPK